MSVQIGTSSLPDRLRWDEYAVIKAAALQKCQKCRTVEADSETGLT